MREDRREHHDVMALVWGRSTRLIEFRRSRGDRPRALGHRPSAEHGIVPCQDRKIHCNMYMSLRDIGSRGMSRGHRDVDLVAPWKGLEGPKYASLHIISVLR
jgi:hypothetical protein